MIPYFVPAFVLSGASAFRAQSKDEIDTALRLQVSKSIRPSAQRESYYNFSPLIKTEISMDFSFKCRNFFLSSSFRKF